MLTPQQIQEARAKLGLNQDSPQSAPVTHTGLKGADLASWADTVQAPTPPAPPSRFSDVPKEVAGDYLKSVGKTFAETPGKIANDISEGAKDIQAGQQDRSINGLFKVYKGMAKAGGRTAADVASAIFAPISAAVGEVFDKTGITDGVAHSHLVDELSNSKWMQDFAMNHPNAGEDFGRALTLAMSGGEKGKIDPATVLERTKTQLAEFTKPKGPPGKMSMSEPAPKTNPAKEPDMMSFQNRTSTAQNEIYGKLTPTEKAKVPLKDTGVGPFKKSVPDLTQSGRTKEIINSVANVPEDLQIKTGDTLAVKDSKLSQAASRLHSETDAALSDPTMKAQTSFNQKRFDSHMKSSVLDPIESELGLDSPEYKAALKAVKTAKGTIESNDASGVYRGRQTFDSAWEKENPAMFKKSKGIAGQLDPRATAMVEGGRAVRTAMNDFAEELLPKNHPFRYRMREESNLLQAREEMRTRGSGDVGKSSYKRFMDRHPIIKKGVKVGGSAAKVGVGVDLFGHI